MTIGIDGSRAFLKNRTGIEEYSYQVIKHFTDSLRTEQVVLYLRLGQEIDFDLPQNWKVKIIKWPRFWTQLGLSLEMLLNPVDVLFIPAHTVPLVHPKKTIVVIHGLEYEFCKEAYSWLEKFYMRLTIKKSCQWASDIISVSENTKKDLMNLYKVAAEKVTVIYEGYDNQERDIQEVALQDAKYFLFIGRIEQRKNIAGVVKAFEIFKKKYKTEHELVLAGRPGFGYEKIKNEIENSSFKKYIKELGFIDESKKWELLKNAEGFIFTTFYEGFGIPVLEAQSAGCPVVASCNSSILEVAGSSALLVDPNDCGAIAEKMKQLVLDNNLREEIIKNGLENIKRFSWAKCAEQIANELKK